MNFIIDIGMPPLVEKLSKLGNVFIIKERPALSEDYFEKVDENGVITIYFRSQKTISDNDKIINYFKDRNIKIDYIFPFNETKYSLWIDLAEKLKVKTHININYAENCNKYNTRVKLNKYHEEVKVYSLKEFLDSDMQFPVILKPKNSNGSQSVYKINSAQELHEISKLKDLSNHYIEEFINGIEMSIEGLHFDNHHVILGVTKKLKYDNTFVEKGHIADGIMLSQEDINKVINTYKILKYDNTVSHSEWMLTDKGIKYIESHPRLGGDLIPSLYESKFENCLYETSIRVLSGDQKQPLELKKLEKQHFSFFPTAAVYPSRYVLTDKIKMQLKSDFNINLIVSNVENNTIVKEIPKDSFDRPIILRGDIPYGENINLFLNKLEKFVQENVFINDVIDNNIA